MANCRGCGRQQICTCSFDNGCIQSQPFIMNVDFPAAGTTNVVSSLDNIDNSITGDIDIRVLVSLDDWTPAADRTLFSKYNTVGDQRSFRMYVDTGGVFKFAWSTAGTLGSLITESGPSTAAYPDGTSRWLRVTMDVDNGGGNREVRFFDSPNGVVWTQLSLVTGAVTSIFNSTASLLVGAINTGGAALEGNAFYAELRRGINGGIVARFDPSNILFVSAQSPTSFVGGAGETWSLSGPGWQWIPTFSAAPVCTTVSGSGQSWAPINYRPNNVPKPRPFGLVTRRGAGQSVTAGASAAIIFTHSQDAVFAGGVVNLTTSPTRLTAPQDGFYLVSGFCVVDRDLCSLQVRKNGLLFLASHGSSGLGFIAPSAALTVNSLVRLISGDYLELVVVNTGGSTLLTKSLFQEPFEFTATPEANPQFWMQWMRGF